MATVAELQTNISNAFAILEIMSRNNVTDYLALAETLADEAKGDRAFDLVAFEKSIRASFATLISPDQVRAFIRGQLLDYAALVGATQVDQLSDAQALEWIRKDMIASNDAVLSRSITFGTPTADGGNEGTGVILRLTEDADGFDIESGHIEAKTATIIVDQKMQGGSRYGEVLEFRGAPRDLYGFSDSIGERSDLNIQYPVWSETSGLLDNPSFSGFTLDGSTIETLEGWEAISALTNFRIDETYYFRANDEVTTPASLRVMAVDGIEQSLETLTLDPNKPYYLGFMVNRSQYSALTGTTIRVTLGSYVYTFPALTTQTGWVRLYLPMTSNLYYKNWRTDQPTIKIEVTVMGSGSLLIDEIIFAEMLEIDRTHYALPGGVTPYSLDDFFTWTDTSANTAINQKWLGLGYGFSAPSATGMSVTWPDISI